MRCFIITVSLLSTASAFAPIPTTSRQTWSLPMSEYSDPNPVFPTNVPPPPQQAPSQLEGQAEGQANTRFSAFAPDQSLEAGDFRAQLKENMKADLERRQKEDPNRGNQPAKSYLDSL